MVFWTRCRLGFAGVAAGLLLPCPAGAGEPASPQGLVRVTGDFVTVQVRDVRLVELLDRLARQAGFEVAPCSGCEQRISVEFERLPLADGLARILSGQSFALGWQDARGPVARPRKLWLLPQARVPSLTPVALGARPALPAPASLALGTPMQRAAAAAELAGSHPVEAVPALARALSDSDGRVRRAAVEALADIGGPGAIDALDQALNDHDPGIREAAVNALGELGGARAIALLRRAQRDPSPIVRDAASHMLIERQGQRR